MLKAILLLTTAIFFLSGWFSGMKMVWYFNKKEKNSNKLHSFNPLIFLKYIESTKEETGKVGIWFKVQCASFVLGMINLVVLIVLYGEA